MYTSKLVTLFVKCYTNQQLLKKIGNVSWAKSISYIHEKRGKDLNSNYYRRLAYDEILSNMLVLSQARKRKKIGKNLILIIINKEKL